MHYRNETALAQSLARMTHALKSEAAYQRMRTAALRLFDALQEQKYRPDQPRAPKGTPEGGQWIVDAGSARQQRLRDERVLVGQFDRPDSFYNIDIEQEDKKGGHGWKKHVGRSRAELLRYMELEQGFRPTASGGREVWHHPAEGTFYSSGEANYWIGNALRANRALVERAIDGVPVGGLVRIRHRFNTETGYEAYRSGFGQPILFRPTFWVEIWLAHDPNKTSRGFRIVTAYPMNEIHNEVPLR